MQARRFQFIIGVGLVLTLWAGWSPTLRSAAGGLGLTPTAWAFLPVLINPNAQATPGVTLTVTASPTLVSTSTPTRTPTSICPGAAPLCTLPPPTTTTATSTPTPVVTPSPTNTPDCLGGEPVDPDLSAFAVQSSTVRADGVEMADLFITIASTCGQLLASQPVTLTASRPGGVDVISPTTGLTNASGQFFSTVRSALSSPLDDGSGVFTPTTLTAQAGAGSMMAILNDQPQVRFTCANGLPAGFSSAFDVQYFFVNETPEARSLDRVTLTWPAGSSALTNMALYPPTFLIWSGFRSTSPAVVNGGWLGTPDDRSIAAAGGSRLLSLGFNVDLSILPGSPNNPFVIQTQWKDETTGRVCTSDFITSLR